MDLNWIKQQLEERGITQQKLGEAIGLDEGKISKALSGSRKLSANEADGIRRFFGYKLPEDQKTEAEARIETYLSNIGDDQKLSVAMYLELVARQEAQR